MSVERARCPVCRRVVTVSVPRGGDGSACVFHKHGTIADYHRRDASRLVGQTCPGSRTIVEDADYEAAR